MFAIDPVSVLLFVVLVLFLINIYSDWKRSLYKKLPPGPKKFPLIGNMHILLTSKLRPHQTFQKLYNAFPSVMRWIRGSHQTAFQKSKDLRDFLGETFVTDKDHVDINDQRNLIDAFVFKQHQEKDNSGLFFKNENLIEILSNLLTAGMETTATTLLWSIVLMMTHPEIQKNVQNEIDKVIGSAKPQTDHRKLMPYTDAVIHEIQRFGNVIPLNIPHATTRDVTFRGYFIPKGTHIIPLLSSVLQDEAYFEKPNEFYPEHFLDSQGRFLKNEAFMPFSAGRRSCVGENLAKIELFLFFTRLLQNFTFQLPPYVTIELIPKTRTSVSPLMTEMCALPRKS